MRDHFLGMFDCAAGAEGVATDFGCDAGCANAPPDHPSGVRLVHGVVG
jgi:hypothetical protein